MGVSSVFSLPSSFPFFFSSSSFFFVYITPPPLLMERKDKRKVKSDAEKFDDPGPRALPFPPFFFFFFPLFFTLPTVLPLLKLERLKGIDAGPSFPPFFFFLSPPPFFPLPFRTGPGSDEYRDWSRQRRLMHPLFRPPPLFPLFFKQGELGDERIIA